jgi:hypothetical protein
VLYRSHFHALELQLELTRRNIPFTITSGIRFFEQAHIKDVTAFIKLLANPADEISLKRIVRLLPGIGGKGADKLWACFSQKVAGQLMPEMKTPMARALQSCASSVPKKATVAWAQLVATVAQAEAPEIKNKPAQLIRHIVEAFYKEYAEDNFANYSARLDELEQLGQFAQDLPAQYAEPVPWLMLRSGELTGVSSIMPQKRNPAALEQLRAQASIMVGEMHTVFLLAHNARTGMFDYRMYDPVPSARPLQVFKLFQQIVAGIVVNKGRALAEVNADYSTTTEIADALLQRSDVPFRAGHHFASALTDYGRSNGLKLADIPYLQAARIYESSTKQTFPLSEVDFKEVISAEYMVFGRKGIGGPQISEVNRMLADESARAAADMAWHKEASDHLADAEAMRSRSFATLARSGGE